MVDTRMIEDTQETTASTANISYCEHQCDTGDTIFLDRRRLPLGYPHVSSISRKLQHYFDGPSTFGKEYGSNAFKFEDFAGY
jgi:hypothetical protein